MLERLTDMAIFAEVVEAGSFTHAADELQLSKGAVSKAVNRLEKHLNIKLLRRTTRSLSLTNEGADFYQYCKVVAEQAVLAEEHIGSLKKEPTGTVTISSPVNYGATCVAPIIAKLKEKFPKLSIDLSLNDSLTSLTENGIDIAIRCGELKDSSLYYRPLKSLKHVMVATPHYLETRGEPIHPNDLSYDKKQHLCLPRSSKLSDRHWYFYCDKEEYQVTVEGAFFTSENRALKEAVKSHLGIAYLPEYSVQEMINDGTVKVILADFMPKPTPVSLLYAEKRYASSAINETVQFLQTHLG
ncbi:MAG: LysR family transcriptional regulator [Pseudomonadota bacterium]